MPPKKRKPAGDLDTKAKRGKKAVASNGDHSDADDHLTDEVEDSHNGLADSADTCDAESDVVPVLPCSTLKGDLLFCGGTNWDLIGRSQLPKGVKNVGGRNVYGPHRLVLPSGVQVRTIVSGCSACHSIVITTEGKTYSWGRNEEGQLGHGNTLRHNVPTLISALADLNIVTAACGKRHTLCLTDHGVVYSFGDNKMGQLGLGYQSPSVLNPTKVTHGGPPIRSMAAGGEFSMIVDTRGQIFSFGCPEFGQLGHNTDGLFTVTAKKLTRTAETRPRRVQAFTEKSREGHVTPVTGVCVEQVACGLNHTVVLDSNKRIFTWGFGGYGRLGHAEPKDEWRPRLVKFFDGPSRGVCRVAAGSSFTMVVNEHGVLYLWGKNKPTGEAAMYPKPVQDLSGWAIRSIGCCNNSIVIAADDSLVSWGPSPTFGELGYGVDKPKSSTTPQEVKPLNGVYVEEVACGYGHTLMIARTETEEDRELIQKLPLLQV